MIVEAPIETITIDEGLKKFADDFDRDNWLHIYKVKGQPALCGFKPKGGSCSKQGCPNTIIKLEYCPVCNLKTCHFCRFIYTEMKKKK